jgi:hypothetical protein
MKTLAEGRASTLKKAIAVLPLPLASFSETKLYRTVSFHPVDSTETSYIWLFGDGTSASIAKPVHTYSKDSTYLVTLKVTNAGGCTATDTASVTVYGKSGVNPELSDILTDLKIYPNPSGSIFNIVFSITEMRQVAICLEDVTGKIVANIAEKEMSQGEHQIQFNPGENNISTGIYLLKLTVDQDITIRKLIYLK